LEKALGSDLPFISSQAFSPFSQPQVTAIYDLGGNGVGAKLIRQFLDFINKEETDLLLCINIYREETDDVAKIIKMINEIESSGGLKVTGLINNSNFLRETSLEDILKGQKMIQQVAEQTKLSIQYTGIWEKIPFPLGLLQGEVIKLKLYLRKNWL